VWGWLPGYSGANGPVLRMTGGTDSFSNAIFLVGAFNNYPVIALWFDDPISGIFIYTYIYISIYIYVCIFIYTHIYI
jgi:hypothetical protein